jgi:hypothetical protein
VNFKGGQLLTQAVVRGVELTLIIESEGESEGQLTRDAIEAFSNVPSDRTHIYYEIWGMRFEAPLHNVPLKKL